MQPRHRHYSESPKNVRQSRPEFRNRLSAPKSIITVVAALAVCATLVSVFVHQSARAATAYTWNGGSGLWNTATNWTPNRTSPAADDIIVFNTAGAITVTNVPTQTIGQISIGGGAQVTLQGAQIPPTINALTISGGLGSLAVASGAQLNVSGANIININLGAATTGTISGSMTFLDAAHRLTAATASPITFQNGSSFTAGALFSGNAFGTTNLNSIVFANGSTYVAIAGSNPFGAGQPNSVVVFQSGSLFSVQSNNTPSFSGRTYANVEVNSAAANLTVTGGAAVVMNNLTISAGILNFNMTATPGHAIKGNISVAAGATLNFNPASAGTVNLNGASPQTVSGTGTLTAAANQSFVVPSGSSVTLNRALTTAGTVTVDSGGTLATGATFTNSGTANINGTFQINQSGFATGNAFVYNAATGTLVFNNTSGSFAVNNDAYWPSGSGPQNVRVQGSGGITMNVPRTVGTSFQYAAGVSGAGNLTLTGLTQVNTGGFTSGSPTYGGVSSLLKYNTGGTYGRNGEWLPGAISGPGYPTHVQLSNNTTLDLVNSSNSPFQMAGDLTIDVGSTMQLSLSPLTNPLTIFGSVNNNGIFNLSNLAGGDVNVGGNWNNNGTFNNNGRTVNLNGSIGQAVSGNSNFFNLTKSSAVAQTLSFAALSTQTITNNLTLNGAAGNLLSLRSNTPGTQWKLNVLGAQSVSFVDVQDSDASGGSAITPTSSVDSGNNVNWTFGVTDYTVTTTALSVVVTDVSGNSDTLTVSEPASGFIKFAAPGRFFSVNGGAPINGDSGNLPIPSVTTITINQENGNDTLNMGAFSTSFPSLTINGGNGDDTVNINGQVALANTRNLDIDLQNDTGTPGIDAVNFGPGGQMFLGSTGTATIKVSRNVTMASASTLQVQDGLLTIEANQQVAPTAGDFNGLDINGGGIFTVGSGNVIVKGRGGDGDFIENIGVRVAGGGQIRATNTGTLDVQGIGGVGIDAGSGVAGQGNLGVYVTGSSTIVSASSAVLITGQGGTTVDSNVLGVVVDELGSLVTNGPGTLTINGTGGTMTGGGSPTFVNSGGVFIVFGDVNGDGGSVQSTGTGANAGAIIINGTANPGGNGSSQGVRVDTPGSVTTVDGPITITGTSAACGNACLGTSIRGNVSATGTGAISLTGFGAASSGAFPTHGVNVRSTGVVSTTSGNITVTGTGGNGGDNAGFNLASTGTGTLQTTGSGNIVVNADTIRISPTVNANINAGANAVSLRQNTNGTAINLGSGIDSTPSTVELSVNELNRVTAGTINIGTAASGAITFSNNILRASATNFNLVSGANIDIAVGLLGSNGGNVSLVPGTNVFPSKSGLDVNAAVGGTLTLTSLKDLKIVINNTTVDSGYTQLQVQGLVNLNNATIGLSGTHIPALGQQFIIVNNDGADPISGIFNSLSEGTVIPHFLGSGLGAQITYVGGDGNDAVLTVVNQPTAANGNVSGQILDSNGSPVEGAAVRLSGTQNRLTVTDAFGNYYFGEVETNGFYTVTPTRVNFVFGPEQRSFSQLGNNTDAVFTAWATGEARNPLDTTEYFVRQQYLDFLGREPDEAGLNFWVNNIQSCGNDANCRAIKRTDTSAAFFLSIEFRETGYLVYRTYQSAYGDLAGAPVPLRLSEFRPDTAKIGNGVVVNREGWAALLEANKQAYMEEFVQRGRFVSAYPTTLTPDLFVDQLFRSAGVTPSDGDRRAALGEFGSAPTSADVAARGRALRRVAENSALAQQESNRAFVLMQYFGYLRRDPNSGPDADFGGFNFWLDKLNTFNGDFRRAEMVRAFLVSSEYRGRFPR